MEQEPQNNAPRRAPRIRESGYSVIFRNNFREALMVLNNPGMFVKHGVEGMAAIAVKRKGWGCPGGGAEKGEKVWEAAVRETLEETGLEVCINEDTPHISTPERDYHVKTYFMLEEFEGEPHPASEEVELAEWIPLEVFLSQDDKEEVLYKGEPIYKGHKRCIRDLLKKLGKL